MLNYHPWDSLYDVVPIASQGQKELETLTEEEDGFVRNQP